MIVATRRSSKNASEAKYKIPRSVKIKISHSKQNKKIKVCEEFSIKVPNSTIEALMMNKMNNNTPWVDAITD